MTPNSLRNCTDRGLVDHNSLCFLSVTFNNTFNCRFVKRVIMQKLEKGQLLKIICGRYDIFPGVSPNFSHENSFSLLKVNIKVGNCGKSHIYSKSHIEFNKILSLVLPQ